MNGAKADNLKRLQDCGMNVPEFTVVPFDGEVDETFLRNDCKYAVRSSCSAEDGSDFSFAGQFDTFLNVDAKDVKSKVVDCFASMRTPNVAEYAIANNIALADLQMNVIIQEMVNSDLSGVLFTANESVITVGKGLGEGIVTDKVDTTSYYYNLTDGVYYYDGNKDLLDNELVEQLISVSIKIKDLFGEYVDIEFAIKDREIFILQARPITTLKTDNPLILDNSNIVPGYRFR